MISDINFTTTRIVIMKAEENLGSATGFFCQKDETNQFLVTNRHVVIDEGEDHFPDHLKLSLHANKIDLDNNEEILISLYDSSNCQLWKEHPKYDELKCDVIAIPLHREVFINDCFQKFKSSTCIRLFGPDLTTMPDINPFGDVAVVGYPLGFFDKKNNLPVYRKAMIASQYGVNFNNKPYFLIDANLHAGTSGSPVVSAHLPLFKEEGAKEPYKLFGIHSAEHVEKDEPLGLSVVWYSYLIDEIISSM